MRILPEPTLRPLSPRAHSGLRTAVRLLFAPFGAFRVAGAEHVPAKGGFLLLPKHQCWADIPYLGVACTRRLRYVAKVELFQTRLGARFITTLGGIPLDRRRPIATRHSLRAIRDALLKGRGVAVFPEGTYVPGRMGDGRSGLLRYLIKNAPVPLIPVGIAYGVMDGRRTVTLRFGRPQVPAVEASADAVLEGLLRRIAKLSGLLKSV